MIDEKSRFPFATTGPAGPSPRDAFTHANADAPCRPIWLLRPLEFASDSKSEALSQFSREQRLWLEAIGFRGQARRHALLPGPDGRVAGVVLGLGDDQDRAEPVATLVGLLPPQLPPGDYRIQSQQADPTLAAIAWGLGSYRFRRYKTDPAEPMPRLELSGGVETERVMQAVEGVWLGRDLINTPANDMGPDELETAARALAKVHGATVTSIIGNELVDQNFPLIHAVGRASPRAPRLVEIASGRLDAPKVTIIGKGICFDTGGLDLKPSAGMLLMKKDMGGAAAALALAHMLLAAKLDVRLRVLLAIAENSVAGDAFRPGDVIRSRAGKTVEIGNTDAEGRLVLADALALADEDSPDYLFTFATLTGAARVALGPDLQPYYCDDLDLARDLEAAAAAVADPVWRLPMTTPYGSWLDSAVADMNNVAEGGFAGSIVAAVFLKKFVNKARRFAHFDIYGWRPSPRPLGPKGGEPQAARAVFEVLRRRFG